MNPSNDNESFEHLHGSQLDGSLRRFLDDLEALRKDDSDVPLPENELSAESNDPEFALTLARLAQRDQQLNRSVIFVADSQVRLDWLHGLPLSDSIASTPRTLRFDFSGPKDQKSETLSTEIAPDESSPGKFICRLRNSNAAADLLCLLLIHFPLAKRQPLWTDLEIPRLTPDDSAALHPPAGQRADINEDSYAIALRDPSHGRPLETASTSNTPTVDSPGITADEFANTSPDFQAVFLQETGQLQLTSDAKPDDDDFLGIVVELSSPRNWIGRRQTILLGRDPVCPSRFQGFCRIPDDVAPVRGGRVALVARELGWDDLPSFAPQQLSLWLTGRKATALPLVSSSDGYTLKVYQSDRDFLNSHPLVGLALRICPRSTEDSQ